MKKAPVCALILFAAAISCNSSQDVQSDRRSAGTTGASTATTTGNSATTTTGTSNQTAATGTVLHLSWSPGTGTTTEYHIFGLTSEANTGGTEVDSLDVTAANKAAPSIDLDLSKTSLPKTGQVCFYVIGDNAGAKGTASTASCLTL